MKEIVWPFPPDIENYAWRRRSIFVQYVVYGLSKLWTAWPLNRSTVYHHDRLIKILQFRRDNGQQRPLLTISNHTSCMDDPLMWGVLLRWRDIWLGQLRWIPAAHELCFHTPSRNFVFSKGQCVPVVRGSGVYQRGVDFCIDRLNCNRWVHLFPEGKINFIKKRRLKWGIGRMLAECRTVPDIVPIWLFGFDDVLPNKQPYIPKVNQRLYVYVGEPLNIQEDIMRLRRTCTNSQSLRKEITDLIEERFWKLKEEAERYHLNKLSLI